MNANPFIGNLVQLTSMDMEDDPTRIAQWGRNTEYQRLLDSDPAFLYSPKEIAEWFAKDENQTIFMIRPLTAEKPIGLISLDGISWVARDAWVGIGIGDPQYWGKGYGTEAMQLVLSYAFRQLNLHRVSLSVFEYNQRGFRSYQKSGFREEGREKEAIIRDGRYWDMIYMGILRQEWDTLHPEV